MCKSKDRWTAVILIVAYALFLGIALKMGERISELQEQQDIKYPTPAQGGYHHVEATPNRR